MRWSSLESFDERHTKATQPERPDLHHRCNGLPAGLRDGAQARVVEEGEPFVVAQADTPHELFHAMDIPLITNQWWSAYISAKQLSGRYFEALNPLGYPANGCRYCSLGLACNLAREPASAPWGGLPSPALLVARLTCDCIQQVFGQWAEALSTEFFALEAPGWTHKDPQWFLHSNESWDRCSRASGSSCWWRRCAS